MLRKSKRWVANVETAVEHVATRLKTLPPGDGLDIERRFPGGKLRFVCPDVTVTIERVAPRKRGFAARKGGS